MPFIYIYIYIKGSGLNGTKYSRLIKQWKIV
jgi:hypothetical protein